MPAFDQPQVTRSQLGAIKTFLFLVAVMVILSWLNQSSISLYCQQKYHSRCELPVLTDSVLWHLGDDLNRALGDAQTAFFASLGGSIVVPEVAVSQVTSIIAPPPVVLQAVTPTRVLPSVGSLHAKSPHPVVAVMPVAAPTVAAPQPVVQAPVAQRLVQMPLPALTSSAVTLQAGDEVFFAGDSLMQGVAPHLANTLLKRFNIKSINLSRQSTGLAYPGFFNWPQTIQSTLESHRKIRLLIIFLGPNDPWDMPEMRGKPFLRFKSSEWESAYRQRVRGIFEQAQLNAVQVIWVGPPNMNATRLSTAMQYLRELYRSEAQQQRQIYLSANNVFGYHADEFSFYSVDTVGKKIKVRVDDGIHFTTAGQKLIAEKILTLINVPTPDILER